MQIDIGGYTAVTSPLDLVGRILADKKFIEPDDGVDEGEVVIGEMSDEEKLSTQLLT